MRLWAIYSDAHTEVDIFGDREGLRALATAATQLDRIDLPLDTPPLDDDEHHHPLESIRIEPHVGEDPRICFRRAGATLLLSGSSGELARIVGGSIGRLAEGPETKNGIGSHLHLDPTSDPERRFYLPDSASAVVGFTGPGE